MADKIWIFTLFSILHLVCSFPQALVDPVKCKKRNGDFPKEGSLCRSFFRCKNWIPREMTCPDDQHFFPAMGSCVWPEEFPCLEKPQSKECPLPKGKFLKPGTRCKTYYDCCNGKPTEKNCRRNTVFDYTRGKCDWPELVTCPEDIITKESTLQSSTYSTSIKRKTTATNRRTTSPKIPTSDKDSSEEGNSSEESRESTTKPKIKSTSPSVPTLSSTIFDKISSTKDVPSTTDKFTEETVLSTNVETTAFKTSLTTPGFESSSTLETNPKTISSASTVEKDLIISKLSTRVTDEIGTSNSYSDVVTEKTSPKLTDGVSYKDKDLTTKSGITSDLSRNDKTSTMTSGITDSVTYHIFCPHSDGNFPHPNDKHKFVACVGGNPTVMDCPSNLIYDHEKKSCQYE